MYCSNSTSATLNERGKLAPVHMRFTWVPVNPSFSHFPFHTIVFVDANSSRNTGDTQRKIWKKEKKNFKNPVAFRWKDIYFTVTVPSAVMAAGKSSLDNWYSVRCLMSPLIRERPLPRLNNPTSLMNGVIEVIIRVSDGISDSSRWQENPDLLRVISCWQDSVHQDIVTAAKNVWTSKTVAIYWN